MTMMPTDFAGTRWGYVYDGDQHVHEPPRFLVRAPAEHVSGTVPPGGNGAGWKDYYQSADGGTVMVTDMRTAVAGVSEVDWHTGPIAMTTSAERRGIPRLGSRTWTRLRVRSHHPSQPHRFCALCECRPRVPGPLRQHLQRLDVRILLGRSRSPAGRRPDPDDRRGRPIAELRGVRDLPGIRGVVLQGGRAATTGPPRQTTPSGTKPSRWTCPS